MEGLDEGKAQTLQQGFDEGKLALARLHVAPGSIFRCFWLCMQSTCMYWAGHEEGMLLQVIEAGRPWAFNRACNAAVRPHWLR